jgi:hypothetical protein
MTAHLGCPIGLSKTIDYNPTIRSTTGTVDALPAAFGFEDYHPW